MGKKVLLQGGVALNRAGQRATIDYGAPRHLDAAARREQKSRPYRNVGTALEAARSFLEESFGRAVVTEQG